MTEPKTKFDDPRVQTVYGILCANESPPQGEHWEGFVARRIVDAIAAPAHPAEGVPAPAADSVLEDAARESEYRRGYRHGYEQRDAEVRGAMA